MTAARPLGDNHEHALGVQNDLDEEAPDDPDPDPDGLTRYGPDVAGARIPTVNSHSTFSPTFSSKSTRVLVDEFTGQRHAADSIATTSSSHTKIDAFELSPLGLRSHMGRAQSFVEFAGRTASRGRFDSTASVFTTASSSSATTSESDGLYEEEIQPRSADQLSLGRTDDSSVLDAQVQCWNRSTSVLQSGAGKSGPDILQLQPMSPRQTHYPHPIYVPSDSHRDRDQKQNDELSQVDLESAFPLESACRSPDNGGTAPVETDTLLPLRKNTSEVVLPLPVTSPTPSDEPRTIHFSFSRLETSFHVLGILITTFLITFSVWLTLANVVM